MKVVPGDILGQCTEYTGGIGTYIHGTALRSSLIGEVVLENRNGSTIINVISKRVSARECVIEVSDRIFGRIVRLGSNQATVEIISVGDRILAQSSRGIIRREDVRASEIDKLFMHECFRPGDIVSARVISLGDSRHYYLSTAEESLGVVWAFSEDNRNSLTPVSGSVQIISTLLTLHLTYL